MTDPTPRDFLHAFNAAQIEEENHARGCAGREYACTCGYDNAMEAEIRRLRREVVTKPPAAAATNNAVKALARLFERFWEQEGGLSSSEWEDWLGETGFVEWQSEGNRYVLTRLGEAALALAKP